MLLSDRDIRAEVESGRIVLDPYDESLVQPSSVDVRLDRFFRVFENHRYPHIDPAVEQPDLTRLVETEGDEPFILHPGEFVLASTYEMITLPDDVASRLEGKALALDTEIPTPSGWRSMGDLRAGDEVFDEHGRPTRVVAASEVMFRRPCFRVEFSDGSHLVADESHQWLTFTKNERSRRRPPRVRTTAEIAADLRVGDEWQHHVPLANWVQYPERDLPLDPYVLGTWLGDGTTDKAETGRWSADGSVSSTLRAMKLLGNKHVPSGYLVASMGQRVSLLQGLMDSDGYVDDRGRCEYVSTLEPLADAVVELAASLGLRPVKRKKKVSLYGVECRPAYQVKFTPHFPVFRLERKVARQKQGDRFHLFRAVVAVREVESVPVRCIQVANRTGLFLAGRTYIPTHNSSLGRLGLLTHSTAGFIDPGFSGHVTLELSNVATLPIKLWPGMRIGQFCFFRLSSPAEHVYGSAKHGSRYQGQRGPTASRSYQNWYRARL